MECSRRILFFVKQKATGTWLTWPVLVNFYIHFNLTVTSNSVLTYFVKPIEGSPKSTLSWKFDLSSTNLVILQATVSCPGTTYEDGEIIWKICGSDHCQILENGKWMFRLLFILSWMFHRKKKKKKTFSCCFSMKTTGCIDFEVDLSGSKWCVLSAEMSRGRGDNAWQHTQIARQSTKELNRFPLCLRIFFGSAD